MNNQLIYLASPYSSKLADPVEAGFQREERFAEVARIASELMRRGHCIYSPIVHCHPIATKHDLPKDWAFWEGYLNVILPKCDEIWVALMDGWRESTGVQTEIKLAKKLGKIVRYVSPLYCIVWSRISDEKYAS